MIFKSSVTAEELQELELISFPGRIHLIEEEGEAFLYAISYLRRQRLIGFDTETRPCFSASQPRHEVSLLQLSGEKEAFLFRVNRLGLEQRLCAILSNPQIIKVGAAVLDDIRGLQRLEQFEPAGFVDLQKMVGDWGIQDRSVKKMAAIVLGRKVSKTQQLSNWEAESLSEAQQMYAATDAWVCRKMYNKLIGTPKPKARPESE